jgi:hypothetical protein
VHTPCVLYMSSVCLFARLCVLGGVASYICKTPENANLAAPWLTGHASAVKNRRESRCVLSGYVRSLLLVRASSIYGGIGSGPNAGPTRNLLLPAILLFLRLLPNLIPTALHVHGDQENVGHEVKNQRKSCPSSSSDINLQMNLH